jgi:hypothetical protein
VVVEEADHRQAVMEKIKGRETKMERQRMEIIKGRETKMERQRAIPVAARLWR